MCFNNPVSPKFSVHRASTVKGITLLQCNMLGDQVCGDFWDRPFSGLGRRSFLDNFTNYHVEITASIFHQIDLRVQNASNPFK